MILVKVLKRKDASSVMVAILVGLTVWQPLMQETARPAGKLLGLNNNQYASYAPGGGDIKATYVYPVVQVILELLILEVLGWLYVWAAMAGGKKK